MSRIQEIILYAVVLILAILFFYLFFFQDLSTDITEIPSSDVQEVPPKETDSVGLEVTEQQKRQSHATQFKRTSDFLEKGTKSKKNGIADKSVTKSLKPSEQYDQQGPEIDTEGYYGEGPEDDTSEYYGEGPEIDTSEYYGEEPEDNLEYDIEEEPGVDPGFFDGNEPDPR